MLARAPPETQRKENWAARPPKEFDFLTFEMNQSGLTQQVLYWGVGGKTKQNTMEQQPTCTNTRWMRLLGEELLKQMANIHFSFRPMSLALKTSSPRAQTPPINQTECLEVDLTDPDVTPERLRCLLCPLITVSSLIILWNTSSPAGLQRHLSHMHNFLP